MRVASKVNNIHYKFGHDRSLRSRVIRCVRDGQTDGRTKAKLTAPFPTNEGIIRVNRYRTISLQHEYFLVKNFTNDKLYKTSVMQLTEKGAANILGYFVSTLARHRQLAQLATQHLSEL